MPVNVQLYFRNVDSLFTPAKILIRRVILTLFTTSSTHIYNGPVVFKCIKGPMQIIIVFEVSYMCFLRNICSHAINQWNHSVNHFFTEWLWTQLTNQNAAFREFKFRSGRMIHYSTNTCCILVWFTAQLWLRPRYEVSIKSVQ